MKTDAIKLNDIKRNWYLVDAKNKTLGRLSSKVAQIIRGKNKVNFTPHLDMSDYVIVINSDYIKVSGGKENKKDYWRHSGYPGGGKISSYKTIKDNNSEILIQKAVKGMLPSNKLTNQLIKHLKVFRGDSHPHASQKPKQLEI